MKSLTCLGLLVFHIASAQAGTLSLAGEWGFSLKSGAQMTDTIRLPGTMNDAGLGPSNTAEVDLSGPYHLFKYEGPAWYAREIEIPREWTGQRVTLFLERCRWETTVWLDGKLIGSQDSLSVPHVHDLGTKLDPGKHRLTICVDNTPKHKLGQFVSALRGGTWGNLNGIIGRIELQATPPVWLDAVQIYPDAAARNAKVKVRIGNATGERGQGELQVGSMKCPVNWDEDGASVEVEVAMPDAALWDQFSPNLQTLIVKLGDHQRVVGFGLRDIEARGTRLLMNGQPLFLRGTLECSVWPLTGYPPSDVAEWKNIYQVIKAHGLNHMRFHSWTPPEAAFIAADEEGVILQVEGPCANVEAGVNPEQDAFLTKEYQRIVDAFGNHPSFCLMACGNEFVSKDDTLDGWVRMLRERDPRRLYTSASAWRLTESREFSVSKTGRGIHDQGTMHDVSLEVAKEPKPIIGHEIGQWTYWPDPAEVNKWTGVMRLKNYEAVHDDLVRKGLVDLEEKYVEACGRFATLLYKEEIELLLRTPGHSGYQLLDLHDYPTQGTALIGPLDAFWDSKGFVSAEGFKRFSGETVPLLRIPKRSYRSDEPLVATLDIAHHGPADLLQVEPSWAITDDQGEVIAHGHLPTTDVPTGDPVTLGRIEASLQPVNRASKLTVTVTVGGFANDWEIWVYPPTPEVTVSPDVLVCQRWEEAKAALAQGRKVLFHAYDSDGTQTMQGQFQPVFWSPVWFPDRKPKTMGVLCDPAHPLLQGFPTEMHSNWQWYHLMQHSRLFILDDTPTTHRPLVQVIDNFARNHKIGVVFEARVGKGQLLVNGFNLVAQADDPAVHAFDNHLRAYVSSQYFQPGHSIEPEILDALFAPAGKYDIK